MLLRRDRSKVEIVDTGAARWEASPEDGIERVMLERDGGEIAIATSVVRYAPGSRFTAHMHDRGEELLVLEGELRDEYGTYARGTYVRNPWGSRHAPFSELGCLLLVKLRQLPEREIDRVLIDRAFSRCVLAGAEQQHEMRLHAGEDEHVALVRLGRGFLAAEHHGDSIWEIFVIEGELEDEQGVHRAGTWIRQPAGSRYRPRSAVGCLLFSKQYKRPD
jgi:anti-sigma factor ChrR (cupin superfamily)